MKSRKILFGIFLAVALIAMIPLTANQVSAQVAPAIFSSSVVENSVITYKVTEFETAGGASSGPAAVGYDAGHMFMGYNLTLKVDDTINMFIDTRDAAWEEATGDTSLIYSGWNSLHGVLAWSPECNITLFPGGTAPAAYAPYEVDAVFSRMSIFATEQLLVYPPNDGQDHSTTMVPMFGPWNDNGTIDAGTWSGSGYQVTTSLNYDTNSTYYMFNDQFGLLQIQYLKIPSTFSRDASGNLLAHWNFSWYDAGYTYFGAHWRWISWAYADGYWPFEAFFQVTTNVATGITQSLELYTGDDSAWKDDTIWGAEHPFLSQVKKLKIELVSVVNPGAPAPGFEAAFVFIGISIVAIAVLMSRKRK
ncbi:MAG: hypothetical protein ACFFBD_04460 [Candidatus Hodarchaeota archaeon]